MKKERKKETNRERKEKRKNKKRYTPQQQRQVLSQSEGMERDFSRKQIQEES